MIGGGGKIGGKPAGTVGTVQATPAKGAEATAKDGASAGTAGRGVGDKFEQGSMRSGRPMPSAFSREGSGAADVLKLARNNPAAARQLVATMAAQTGTTLSSVLAELEGAKSILEKMAAQRFSKKSRDEVSRELRAKREKLASLKMRMRLGLRKMAFLQQLAGKLGDPRLQSELDRLLGNHRKLQTNWAKRHHLLSVSEHFYGHDSDTPEHLRNVVRTDARSRFGADELAEALSDASPRRAFSQMVARTLDGSAPISSEAQGTGSQPPENAGAASWKTPRVDVDSVKPEDSSNSTLRTWKALSDLMCESMDQDPLQQSRLPDKPTKPEGE